MPSLARAAEAGEEPAGSWLTLGFFAANFVAFLFILIRFALPLARSFFADRAASIRASLEKAQSAMAEADALARAAEARKAGLDAELARIKAELEAETAYQIARIGEIAQGAHRTTEARHRDYRGRDNRGGAAPRAREAGGGGGRSCARPDRAQLQRRRSGPPDRGLHGQARAGGAAMKGSRVAKRYARALLEIARARTGGEVGRRTRAAGALWSTRRNSARG